MNQNVIKARHAVNALFTNHTLQLKVTDYDIDQTADLVECAFVNRHSKEKMMLIDQVKSAKRLSQKRNLLNDGDFELSNWSGENGWEKNNYVVFASDNPMFKGRYLNIPGATTVRGKTFPTYVYQRVDESKLKPYTRYVVRGFVGNSHNLEVFVARYDKKVCQKMNVRNESSSPIVSNTNGEGNPSYDRYTKERMVPHSSDRCKNPHEFKCHIDIGELDLNEGPGICIGFKIGTTDGMATVDNIEVVEAYPLKGEDLTRIKKREYKWKQKWAKRRIQIEKTVQVVQDAIQNLFTCPQQNRLKWMTTLGDIVHIETMIQKIPYVYKQFFLGDVPVLPGKVYDILQKLSTAVATAQTLYEQRNVVSNGDFRDGLSNWHATDGAEIQQIRNSLSVLVISDWSANVSQDLPVDPAHGYLLRVTARKEDAGEGYVTISDCVEQTERLTFTSYEERMRSTESLRDTSMDTASTGETPYLSGNNPMNAPANRYGGNTYLGSTNMSNYPSEGFGINPYGDEHTMMNDSSHHYERNAYPSNNNMTNDHRMDCGCGCSANAYPSENSITNYRAEGYETESYPPTSPMTDQNGSSLSGYVTKTIEIFPETNQVRIQIGETAGTFMVESVELLRIEEMDETNNSSVDVQTVMDYTPTTQFEPVSFTESTASPRHSHYAYSHDSNIGYVNPNWMSQISDNATFGDLSIPGTHNTMALHGGDITQCQTMSLSTQLNAGIRYLDIRCKHESNMFSIYHGIVYQHASFEDVCLGVTSFLRENPSETIFMRIKEEGDGGNNNRSFADTFADYKSRYNEYFWNWTSDNPRLSDIRRKIVVLQDFSGSRFGISYHILNKQDQYDLNTNWDLHDYKWLPAKSHLYAANDSYNSGSRQVFLNYLSGSGGSFPYFVVSGHSSPGTDASRLSTGLTTPAFEGWYPDFPRVDCFIGICTIAFEGTNILTSNLIEANNFNYVGIIATDFPGGGLIGNIINMNSGVGIQEGVYQMVSALNDSSVVDLNQTNENVTLWSNNGGGNQAWKFVYDSNRSAYQIKSIANENLVLTWAHYSSNRDNVIATSNRYGAEQYWIPEHTGGGYYRLRNSANPDGALDVIGSSTENGTNILYWSYNGANNQKFKLKAVNIYGGQVEGIYLYAAANYAEKSVILTHDVANFQDIGMNDVVSSMKIIGPYEVILYAAANYSGQSVTRNSNVANFKDIGMNDVVSSIKINRSGANII
ncbi:hypothetical protein BW897_28085 [Bacillus cereus]|uniref:1-phosphatidylinositol phosphodiesterase n=1 Tax=Bacillus cereus TaxID=1396 RepID=A0A1S9TH23_BACCE|nr:phosphatidylinositol-specific phospholipase C domain-containing protein [Bacillus cereus]OOR09355.1 hypothetical protein BW897_28085 [Bacillus cereus]